MNLSPLRVLLGQSFSHQTCLLVLAETLHLYREDLPSRWYFLLLNRIFAQLLENPEFPDVDTSGPILDVIYRQTLMGLDAIEQLDDELLVSSANQLTEAYCAMR